MQACGPAAGHVLPVVLQNKISLLLCPYLLPPLYLLDTSVEQQRAQTRLSRLCAAQEPLQEGQDDPRLKSGLSGLVWPSRATKAHSYPQSKDDTAQRGREKRPGETQRSGFARERKNGEMSEACCLRRGVGYEARPDDRREKTPALFCAGAVSGRAAGAFPGVRVREHRLFASKGVKVPLLRNFR